MDNTNTPNEKPENDIQNMDPTLAATLAYFIPPLTGIFFYLNEKEDKFVKFSAIQSMLSGITAYTALAISKALTHVYIGLVLVPLVSVAILGYWLFLLYKTNKHEEYELPYLGKIAKEHSQK